MKINYPKISTGNEFGKVICISVVIFLISFPLFSQRNGYYLGRIVDSSTGKPVAFAAAGLMKNRLGIFANEEGDFKILQSDVFLSDTLLISCIGYRSARVAVNRLDREAVNVFRLTPAIYDLDEVKVVALKKERSNEIISRAIRNIRRNYPQDPFSYVAYYRDYQKRNDLYFNMNEAIVYIKDAGFLDRPVTYNSGYDMNEAFVRINDAGLQKKPDSYISSMLYFGTNSDFPVLDISPYYDNLTMPYYGLENKFIRNAVLPDNGGNELFTLMAHDAIRNNKSGSFSFVNRFSTDFLQNHNFTDIIKVLNNDTELYRISFKAKKWLTGDSLELSGEIFIQPDDYSIHKLDYSGYYLDGRGGRKKMFNIKTEYGYEGIQDERMHLKYISFSNVFNIIDTADHDYFRIIESYFDDYTMTNLFLVFNNRIDSVSAMDQNCYRITIGDEIAKIKRIDVGERRIKIVVERDNHNARSDNSNSEAGIKPKSSVLVQNLKDVNGRILNERKYLEYYQFRELFVQEYNSDLVLSDSCRLKNMPLIKNCVVGLPGDRNYWLNAPAAPEIKKIKR